MLSSLKREMQMESLVEVNVEPRKEWAAPELKKIHVEEITASLFSPGDDGDGPGSAS